MPREATPGFTLVEVTIAIAVLAVGAGMLASVSLATARANAAARRADVAQRAAVEKLEQLRALSWTSDGGVVPISDWSSNVATSPQSGTGGTGLGVSPGDTLVANVAGYSDVLDIDGRWLAAGTTAPLGAAWSRRWSVQALPAPADTLLLQVVVVPIRTDGTGATTTSARSVNGAWLMDMRTRRAR